MKTIMALFLLLLPVSALAVQPECAATKPPTCSQGKGPEFNEFATVPEPGTFALMGLGLTGLVIALKRRG